MSISRRYREANYHILDYGREPDFGRAPDAVTYWFLAAVLCAFIGAGIVAHRTGAIPSILTQATSTGHPTAQVAR